MDVVNDEESLTGSIAPRTVSEEASPSIDTSAARFPLCVVWTPLPIISWLAPFVGHVGICRQDGVILDFAGPYFVNVDNFAFGAVARYVRLSREQCCLPHYLSDHTCASGFDHAQCGTVQSWDDGIRTTMQQFQHTSYNLFTCNCHSFVASCLNKLAYKGSIKWNIISIVLLILFKGQWVSKTAILRSFAPFLLVIFLGYYMVGWPFFTGWTVFNFLLIGWFLLGTYIFPNLLFQC